MIVAGTESELTFQEITRNTMLKRTNDMREKRKQDLQRIRDMRSKCGVHPFNRFPQEIWEMIISELDNPLDIGNVLVVHELFRNMLEGRQIRDVLFPQILPLQIIPFWKPMKTLPPGLFPRKFKPERKSFAEYFPLRQVSKTMRNVIDKWHEDRIVMNLCVENEVEIPSKCCTFSAENPENSKLNGILENFLKCTQESNRSMRFFLRSIKVEIIGDHFVEEPDSDEEEDEDDEAEVENVQMLAFIQFRDKMTQLLEIIGDQIWRFEFDVTTLEALDSCKIKYSEVYMTLRSWAVLMPNLKWLVLSNGSYCDSLRSISLPSELLQEYPFPRLEHLERICYKYNRHNFSNIFEIFASVIIANPHVRALSVSHCTNEDDNETFYNFQLNKLLSSLPLNLEVLTIDTEASDAVKFEHILPTINLNWPLKRMQLGFDVSTASLRSTFQLLKNFPTLEHLNLDLVDPQFDEEVSLRLPNLTQLELTLKCFQKMKFGPGTNFFFTLQFLLHSRKLKRLDWAWKSWGVTVWALHCYLITRERKEEMPDFRGGIWDLRKSNIWDAFPELDYVEVEMCTMKDRSFFEYCRADRY